MVKRNQNSIAFPSLGTGVLKYPPVLVADIMIETCMKFLKIHSNITINIVIFNEDNDVLKVFFIKNFNDTKLL
jgi:O-acetyl-ADP-ribose deacetylase (regulator of RNase III)